MKRIQYGLSIIIMFGSMSIHAMEDEQIVTWAQQIEAIAGQLPPLAEHVSLLSAGSLSPVAGQTMNVPAQLQTHSDTLITIACAMRTAQRAAADAMRAAQQAAVYKMYATQKIPVIEQEVVQGAKERFEWEMKYLRPGDAPGIGRDRKYICNHLRELLECSDEELPENKIPYIPYLIDYMLNNRNHNECARIILERAKAASKFHDQALREDIIRPCLSKHLQMLDEGAQDYITQEISERGGCRYFALKAVRQWFREQQGDDEDGSDDDKDSDDDDSGDEQDEDYQAASASNKRTTRKRSLQGNNNKRSKK
jgi:hypothetical protein